MKSLVGKVAVVTGAGSGIGKALTQSLLQRGATVWGLDINSSALSSLEREAEKFSEPIQTLKVDVTNYDDMKSALKEMTLKTPAIHFWINNAGISGLGDFMEKSLDEFDQTLKVNLNGVVIGTRLADRKSTRLNSSH